MVDYKVNPEGMLLAPTDKRDEHDSVLGPEIALGRPCAKVGINAEA